MVATAAHLPFRKVMRVVLIAVLDTRTKDAAAVAVLALSALMERLVLAGMVVVEPRTPFLVQQLR